jgi:hypothetical protein
MEKYEDHEVCHGIMAGQIWQGMTAEQLIESIGHPHDVDQSVYKGTTKENWKYETIGKNRYLLQVYLENGAVEGWKRHGASQA